MPINPTTRKTVYSTSSEQARMSRTGKAGMLRVMGAPRPCQHGLVVRLTDGEDKFVCTQCGALVDQSNVQTFDGEV